VSAIGEIFATVPRWLSAAGDDAEIVFSSRVRLARNLKGRRFPHHAGGEELRGLYDRIMGRSGEAPAFGASRMVELGGLEIWERRLLAERHLVSREVVENAKDRGLRVSADQDLSVLVNEEDHLRLQALVPGFQLDAAAERLWKLEKDLDERLEFAFSDRYGYLTTCPTNTGTGMRASVMMHLPGLVHRKEIGKILKSLRSLRSMHFTIRGMYGEGTEVMGNFFQISNNATLGVTEEEILEKLDRTVRHIVEYEQSARKRLFATARRLLEDKIWRAYGLLRHARILNTREMLGLVSAVRLGVGQGLVRGISLETLNELLVYSQPFHVRARAGRELDTVERDHLRARYVRERLVGPGNGDGDSPV
jgi:protein arginine kinase